jgi:eukaryotic-like serine/threonine-protein kinase
VRALPAFSRPEEELQFLRGLTSLGRMADQVLEDCLLRGLGLSAAVDTFLTQCVRMIHAQSAFVHIRGTQRTVLTRSVGERTYELDHWTAQNSTTKLDGGRTLFLAPLSLGTLNFGTVGFVLSGAFENNLEQVEVLVEALAEHLDSAVLGFLALHGGRSAAQRLDELDSVNALEASTQFSRYRLLTSLGAGGMAQVMLARTDGPEGISRLVALKRILPHLSEDKDIVRQFLDEAKLAMRLSHPNLVTTHDFGTFAGTYFLVMELIVGADFDHLIYSPRGALPAPLISCVMSQALDGLEAAHNSTSETGQPLNLVHRDLSPHNIMVGFDGRTKVLDFGVAKNRAQRTVTLPGIVKGKPLYMSPEQACAEPLDRRSDVFAMGLILFEAMTQRRAFDRQNNTKTMEAIVNDVLERPAAVDARLWAIAEQALQKLPAHRFQSAAEMSRALTAALKPCSLVALGAEAAARAPERVTSAARWAET